nr:MAG TPA: hypothetical protein [Caudoviricetes sp.]
MKTDTSSFRHFPSATVIAIAAILLFCLFRFFHSFFP